MSDKAELAEAEADVRGCIQWGGSLARASSLKTVIAEYDRRGEEIERLRERIAELEAQS